MRPARLSLHLAAVLLLCWPLAPASLRAEAQAPASAVEIQLVLQVPAAAAFEGSLALRPVSGEAAPRKIPVPRDRSPVVAELPPGSRWEITAELAGYWAPPAIVTAAADPGVRVVQPLALWPLGTIAGSVKLADPKDKPPKAITVATVEAPRPPGQFEVPRERLACPIGEDGRWQCSLPAIRFDLALSAEGFVPHYRWGLEVPAGKTREVGVLDLKRGASVTGWAEVEGGAIDEQACVARLLPLLAGASGHLGDRIRSTAPTARVRKDGFFQLTGVTPGRYVLEVQQPSYAPARAFPVEVWPGAESSLREPLTLRRPLALELTLSPPLDWLGKPWRAKLLRAGELSGGFDREPAFDGTVSEEGKIAVVGQSPGNFKLIVSDSLGNSIASEERKVTVPEEGRWDVDIELITVRGKVRLGDEPLVATLWFGGRHGLPGVKMESDERGAFHGVLPKEGLWQIEVASDHPAIESKALHRVEADRAGRATVEIELPDTHLFGRVVDEDGRPQAALVSVTTDLLNLARETKGDGKFEARAVEPGFAHLLARSRVPEGGLMSDHVTLFVTEGNPAGPVELRLRRMKPVAGKVVSPLGPVAGASVVVSSRRPDFYSTEKARTDLDGTFQSETSAKAETALVVVSPPGFALRAFEVPASGEPVVLQVTPQAGTLEVAIPYAREEISERALTIWILQNGLPLAMHTLVDWVRGHGEQITDTAASMIRVPAMAPGEYRACFVPLPRVLEIHRTGWSTPPPGSCAAGVLTDGSTLLLELPRAWK